MNLLDHKVVLHFADGRISQIDEHLIGALFLALGENRYMGGQYEGQYSCVALD